MRWYYANFNNDGDVVLPNLCEIIKCHKNFPGINIHSEKLVEDKASFFVADTNNQFKKLIFSYDCLVLAGDITLHNKKELINSLQESSFTENIESELLILRLFYLYGPDIVKSFVGEFSFMIYNKTDKNLFVVRDQIGMKTIFHSKSKSNFIITSDIFLFGDSINFNKLNHNYFNDFYCSNGSYDGYDTPFIDISRVPSGSYLEINKYNEWVEKSYWSLSSIKEEVVYSKESEYEDHFLDLLTLSVSDRLVVNKPNAIMMSGGLDSTAIYAVAKEIAIKQKKHEVYSISGVFNKFAECDEREYIDDILKKYKSKGVFEVSDSHVIFKNFPDDAPFTYEPCVNSASYAFTSSFMNRAMELNTTNMLTGYAGDHILNGSIGVVTDLIKQNKIAKAIEILLIFSKVTRSSFLQNSIYYGLLPMVGLGWSKELYSSINLNTKKNLDMVNSYNKKEFIKQLDGTKARLFSDRVIAPRYGVECQHPYLDKRLIEFMYKVPGNIKWSPDSTKKLLRKSMKEYLPDTIRNRKNKTSHLPLTYLGLKESWVKLYHALEECNIEKYGFITRKNWIDCLSNWRQGVLPREDIWLLITMELWFYRNKRSIG